MLDFVVNTKKKYYIQQTAEKSTKYNKPLCMAFIGFEKAFDFAKTSADMQALRRQGIDELYNLTRC